MPRMPVRPVAHPVAVTPGRGSIHFGAGFRLRRLLIGAGWILLPPIVAVGVRLRSPLHFITAAILLSTLWPVTVRSGEVLLENGRVFVRRYFRYHPLEADRVETAVVTPPVFRRQSLVLRLRKPLLFSRYVYCRLAPDRVCDAWALIHERDWEPR